MIYELRIYYILEGRMDAINKRFSNHTLKFFEKHGIGVVDFWEDATGLPKLYYVLAYDDMEARSERFGAFQKDPDWIETRRQSELDGGPIVEKVENFFMTRVPYFTKE